MSYTIKNWVDKMPPSLVSVKCPYAMNPIGITVHNTANSAPAANEAKYMLSNNQEVSFHVAIDNKDAIELIPFNRNAWHAGDGSGDGNRRTIGIEICYSTGDLDIFLEAEENAAEYIAYVLHDYGWGIDRVYKHQDWSGKYCPHKTLDLGWQRFINMVQANYNEIANATTQNPEPVAEDWQDKAIQEVCERKGLDINHWKPKKNNPATIGDLFGILNKIK